MDNCPARLFTVLYFSIRSPRSHANSETCAIFVCIEAQPGEGTKIHRGSYERWHHGPQRAYLRRPPPRWIVVLSPGCGRNINKDSPRFGVRVRSWRSYGKIEDCKRSIAQLVNKSIEQRLFSSLIPANSYPHRDTRDCRDGRVGGEGREIEPSLGFCFHWAACDVFFKVMLLLWI